MKLTGPVDLIRESIKIFFEKKNLLYFLKVYSIAFIIGVITFIFSFVAAKRGLSTQSWVLYLPSIIFFPINLWAHASGYEAVKRVVGSGPFEFKDTYKSSWKYLWKFLVVNFLVGLIVVGGVILLIVPGIIFGVWYAFSTWGVVDKSYGVGRSLKESKTLVAGRFWKVFGRLLVLAFFMLVVQTGFSFLPAIGPLAVTIFGGLFLLPYYLLYRELASE